MKEVLLDKEITATIDQETQDLEVWQIIKSDTFIVNNQNLNFVLSDKIDIDAILYFLDDDNDQQTINNGSVIVSITDSTNKNILYSKIIEVQEGRIQHSFVNTLPLGEYLLKIEYPGSKYKKACNLIARFIIDRRDATCVFKETMLQGYPNESINIDMCLIDKKTNKSIPNCTLYYFFNGFQYITKTDDQGCATLQITMPNVSSYACPQKINDIVNDIENQTNNIANVYYFDNNGHIKFLDLTDQHTTEFTADGHANDIEYEYEDIEKNYENLETFFEDYYLVPQFPLIISIEHNNYKLSSVVDIDILNKRYNTKIEHTTDIVDTVAHIVGRVMANDDKNNNFIVEYGKISFNIDEFSSDPYKQTLVDDDGYFAFDVDLSQTKNAGIIETDITSFHRMYDTVTEIFILNQSLSEDKRTRLSRSYLNKHRMNFKAEVKSNDISVRYGMITFVITDGTNEVYRYVTEIDQDGRAYFNFDVSKTGEFQIKAKYHGIFEFNSSQSDVKDYIIIDENEE